MEICDDDTSTDSHGNGSLRNLFTEGGVMDSDAGSPVLFDDAAIATLLMEEELRALEEHRYFDRGTLIVQLFYTTCYYQLGMVRKMMTIRYQRNCLRWTTPVEAILTTKMMITKMCTFLLKNSH